MFTLRWQMAAVFFALYLLSQWQQVNAQTTQQNQLREESIKQQQRLKEQGINKRIEQQKNAPRSQLEAQKTTPFSANHLPTETSCLDIHTFEIVLSPQSHLPDNSIRTFSFLNDVLSPYEHQCIGEKGIQFLSHQLMQAILEKGYTTTRITIPEQNLSQHKLVFQVIPGFIGKINFQDPEEPAHWQFAFPMRTGDILNIRDLEQGIEQIKRLSNQDIDIQILPGSQLGESHLMLTTRHADKNYTLFVGLDNSGEKETGRYILNAGITYENLFNRYDSLSLTTSSNANIWEKDDGLKSLGLNFSIPYGYWTTGFSLYGQRSQRDLAGNASVMTLADTTEDASIYLQYLAYRNQSQKNTLEMRLGKHWSVSKYHIKPYEQDNDLSNEEAFDDFTAQQKNTTSVTLSWQHTHYFQSWQWDLALYHQMSQGKNVVIDAQPDKSTTFTIQSIDSNIQIPFTVGAMNLTFSTVFHGQYAAKNLSGDQHISLGNRYTVRGYELNHSFSDGTLLSAERGMYLRNTLYLPLWQSTHSLYGALDVGKIYIRDDATLASQGEHLVGAAFGIQGAVKTYINYDLYLGVPVSHPDNFGSTHPSVVLSLSYTY